MTYHRRLRSKGIASVLDAIPGIGEKTRKALFERFGSIEAIISAAVEELTSVRGISSETAQRIKGLKTGLRS